MEHFLSLYDKVCKDNWGRVVLTNLEGRSYTHSQIAENIIKLHLLYQSLDLQTKDKVSIIGKNSAEWVISFLSVVTYHAVAVPILAEFSTVTMENLINHSESRVLFINKAIFKKLDVEKLNKICAIVSLEDFSILYSTVTGINEEILEKKYISLYPNGLNKNDVDFSCQDLEELVVINYTSGTTGQPKGIMIPARSISNNVEYGHKNIPNSPKDNALSMLPLGHMYGLTFEFLYTFLGGCHVFFLSKTPSPTVLKKAFAVVKPYILITVPLVLEKLVKNQIMPVLNKKMVKHLLGIPLINKLIYRIIHNKMMQTLGGSLRAMPIGGAALNPDVESILMKINIPFTVGYGMTECGPLIGYVEWKKFKPGTCGRVVGNMEVRVTGTNEQTKVGEIEIKGANVMLGYYKDEEATRQVFTEDGWLRTGDLGYVDEFGNIVIKGRSKCMILTANGQNIYPEEIEQRLNNYPYIKESIVVERNRRLVAIVSTDIEKESDMYLNMNNILETIRKEVNNYFPTYSQINKIELLNGDFVHTPKKSIKRCLYQ